MICLLFRLAGLARIFSRLSHFLKVLKVSKPDRDATFFVSVSPSPAAVSNSISLHSRWMAVLGFKAGDEVTVEPHHDAVPALKRVHLAPVHEDDWEILVA